MITEGFAPTAAAERYIQQVAKHWSHKFAVTYDAGAVVIPFTARADGIAITLEVPGAAAAARMQEVIAVHINRFAFREGPLAFTWSAAP
jgi:hypothetical protein